MRSRYLLAAFLFSILAFGPLTSAWGQYTTGTITGTVTDSTGAALPGVTVQLKNQDTSETRTYKTGAAGDYVFPALAPGKYNVTVTAPGFEQATTTVTASSSQTVPQDFSLKKRARRAQRLLWTLRRQP
jgi:hypothetical protein